MKVFVLSIICFVIALCAFAENRQERIYKQVTENGRRVGRWLDFSELYEYDENGGRVHYKNAQGFETWSECDSFGNEIHTKSSDGEEVWYEYDDKNKVIHSKNKSGDESFWEYDSKCREIHYISDYLEAWYEYDDKGNCIHFTTNGFESWYEYDAAGNKIHTKDSFGDESWVDFDSNGKTKSEKKKDGSLIFFVNEYEYFPNGKLKSLLVYKYKK